MGKNFRFRDFWFKIRFETFRIDSDQKTFFDQNFLIFSFFHHFWPKKSRFLTFLDRKKNFFQEKISHYLKRFSTKNLSDHWPF